MKQLIGKTNNIRHTIVGKALKKFNISVFMQDSILITDMPPKHLIGYKMVITNALSINNISDYKYPIIYGVQDIDSLNEGDVLSVEQSGQINVVYDKYSTSNILLITERCNANCLMCPQRISNYENTSLNMKVISLMDKNTEYLGLTGGEPTLLKDDLIKIIRECKHKLPKTTIALLTNGILLDDFDYIKELVSINHPNIIFQIPLYADNDTEHNNIMQSNSFYRTIKGIHNLALFNQKIEIRTVVHALNYRRLAKLSEFIYRNFPFVYHIAFMGLELEEKAKENINLLWIDPYEYRDKLRQAIMTLHRAHLNVSIYNHQLCILPEELWKYSEKSISIWKNEYLNICSNCDVKDRCGGLFRSCMVKHSDHLQPVKMSV